MKMIYSCIRNIETYCKYIYYGLYYGIILYILFMIVFTIVFIPYHYFNKIN